MFCIFPSPSTPLKCCGFSPRGHMKEKNPHVSTKGSKFSGQPAGAKVPQVKQMLLLAND